MSKKAQSVGGDLPLRRCRSLSPQKATWSDLKDRQAVSSRPSVTESVVPESAPITLQRVSAFPRTRAEVKRPNVAVPGARKSPRCTIRRNALTATRFARSPEEAFATFDMHGGGAMETLRGNPRCGPDSIENNLERVFGLVTESPVVSSIPEEVREMLSTARRDAAEIRKQRNQQQRSRRDDEYVLANTRAPSSNRQPLAHEEVDKSMLGVPLTRSSTGSKLALILDAELQLVMKDQVV